MEEKQLIKRRVAKVLPPEEHAYLAAKRQRIDLALREFETERRNGTLPTSRLGQRILAALPPLEGMPQGYREIWGAGSGTDYDLAVVAPFVIAAEEAASRAEFHRLVGMYGTGYRSRLREVWFRLSLRTTLTLSGQRLETRRLYRHVKDRLRALAEPTPGAAARERREGAGGTLVQ